MQQEVNIRQLVMEMLLAVTRKEDGEYSHVVIREVQNKYNYLSLQEKAFMKRLFEGTLERMIELDYCIDCFSKVKVNKMKPVIRTIMRMGVYQILYMDSVPDSAACNEAVKLAQKKGFMNLKGFVNGVLRNVARNKDSIPYPDPETEYEKYLSVTYSMPEWIVQMWIQQLGNDTTVTILKSLLEERPVTIRLRTGQESFLQEFRESLAKQGGTLNTHPYLPYAYVVHKTDDITRLSGFEEGKFTIQDVSSMLAIEALGLRTSELEKDNSATDLQELKILDICAAPGGKTMLVADKLRELKNSADKNAVDRRIRIEARDISENKVALMQENFDRCHLEEAKAVAWDALEPDEDWIGQADIVIADVPCSGLGVIGRKRDIKYKMTPKAVKDIVALQEKILTVAASYVKKGGKLLFSTCTINKEENEAHAEWLRNTLKMTPVSLNDFLPQILHTRTTGEGYLQLLPGVHDSDGFFISVFQK